jgi:hypothetical protein
MAVTRTATANHLKMSAPAVCGTIYTYPTQHTLDEVLEPGYFNPASQTLRPADAIRVVQTDIADFNLPGVRVLAFAGLIVTEVGPGGVKVAVEHPAASVQKPKSRKAPPSEVRTEQYIKEDGAEAIEDKDGEVTVVTPSGEEFEGLKDLAHGKAVAAGAAPLPV